MPHSSRSLDGLGEYDRRRPMTPTGTNLLGLVKHLRIEYGYLGSAFGRPAPELPWVEDGSLWQGADMWATPDESSEYLLGLYQDANQHADETIRTLDLSSPGFVAHWPEHGSHTDLGSCWSGWSPRPPTTRATPTSSAR